jgi:hypothetical protein
MPPQKVTSRDEAARTPARGTRHGAIRQFIRALEAISSPPADGSLLTCWRESLRFFKSQPLLAALTRLDPLILPTTEFVADGIMARQATIDALIRTLEEAARRLPTPCDGPLARLRRELTLGDGCVVLDPAPAAAEFAKCIRKTKDPAVDLALRALTAIKDRAKEVRAVSRMRLAWTSFFIAFSEVKASLVPLIFIRPPHSVPDQPPRRDTEQLTLAVDAPRTGIPADDPIAGSVAVNHGGALAADGGADVAGDDGFCLVSDDGADVGGGDGFDLTGGDGVDAAGGDSIEMIHLDDPPNSTDSGGERAAAECEEEDLINISACSSQIVFTGDGPGEFERRDREIRAQVIAGRRRQAEERFRRREFRRLRWEFKVQEDRLRKRLERDMVTNVNRLVKQVQDMAQLEVDLLEELCQLEKEERDDVGDPEALREIEDLERRVADAEQRAKTTGDRWHSVVDAITDLRRQARASEASATREVGALADVSRRLVAHWQVVERIVKAREDRAPEIADAARCPQGPLQAAAKWIGQLEVIAGQCRRVQGT